MTPFSGGVSLVVPLQDEEATIDVLLQSLAQQTLRPTELVVVNAGSTDHTVERLRSVIVPFHVRVVEASRVHPGEARNLGAEVVSTQWIAFTDGGIRLDPGWLASLGEATTNAEVEVVLGSYEPICDSFFTKCAALAYVAPRGADGFRGPSVVSMALRRQVFNAVGGFPNFRASEDLIFLDRISNGGFRCVRAARAVAYWRMAADVPSTFRRFRLYSYHNLLAGRGRYWHHGIARHYAYATLLGTAVLLSGHRRAAVLALPAWLVLRALRAAWTKRRSFDFATWNPLLLLGTAAVLLITDAATIAGAWRWLTSPRS